MIRLINLNKVYKTNAIEVPALRNVNLTIGKNQFVAIKEPWIYLPKLQSYP